MITRAVLLGLVQGAVFAGGLVLGMAIESREKAAGFAESLAPARYRMDRIHMTRDGGHYVFTTARTAST